MKLSRRPMRSKQKKIVNYCYALLDDHCNTIGNLLTSPAVLCAYSARRGVEQAKKKVRQQAKQIRELEEKLQNNGLEQHTCKTINHVIGKGCEY